MKAQILPLFRDILLVCEEEGLLGGTFFALDGCRISSNASKGCSGKISEFKDAPQTKTPGLRTNFDLVNEDLGATKIAVRLIKFEPGAVQERYHYHKKREQVYIGLEGSGTIILNGVEHQLTPNTVVFNAAGDKHGVKGAGKEGLTMIEISSLPYTPGDMYSLKQ